MISGISASQSALQAFQKKTEASANNIANLNTDGFKKDVVTLSEGVPSGVTANVRKDASPGPLAQEQTATGEELVEQSNVELTEELPNMILNQHAFAANLKAIRGQDEMNKSVLDLIA